MAEVALRAHPVRPRVRAPREVVQRDPAHGRHLRLQAQPLADTLRALRLCLAL